MRHRRSSRKLSRSTSNRKALLRSLVRGLIISERISTTYAKAKEASSLADKVINLGKRNTITSKKTAISILGSKMLINKLFDDIAPRFAGRKGGYTRVLQLVPRKGDGAKMALLELTERKIVEKPSKKAGKRPKEIPSKVEGRPKEVPERGGIPKREAEKKKKLEKPMPKEGKPPSGAAPKVAPITTKEKLGEEKRKERAKSEKEKLQKGFFKGLRRYFRRKAF